MTIGQRIKKERQQLNLSQDEVAKYIGSTKQAIYKYENEIVTNIPIDKVAKMAELFGTTPAFLMGWTIENKNSPSEESLNEGEKMLLDLFRRVPEDKQKIVLQMIRAALGTHE